VCRAVRRALLDNGQGLQFELEASVGRRFHLDEVDLVGGCCPFRPAEEG